MNPEWPARYSGIEQSSKRVFKNAFAVSFLAVRSFTAAQRRRPVPLSEIDDTHTRERGGDCHSQACFSRVNPLALFFLPCDEAALWGDQRRGVTSRWSSLWCCRSWAWRPCHCVCCCGMVTGARCRGMSLWWPCSAGSPACPPWRCCRSTSCPGDTGDASWPSARMPAKSRGSIWTRTQCTSTGKSSTGRPFA